MAYKSYNWRRSLLGLSYAALYVNLVYCEVQSEEHYKK